MKKMEVAMAYFKDSTYFLSKSRPHLLSLLEYQCAENRCTNWAQKLNTTQKMPGLRKPTGMSMYSNHVE